MTIDELSRNECVEFTNRNTLGRLACALHNQPYIVPINFAYESGCIYAFSTLGKKIEWMRENPKVCLSIDEIANETQWTSVLVNGEYEELVEPRFAEERDHARNLLEKRCRWWQTAFAERQTKDGDQLMDPIFFRIKVQSMSGLRARADG
jgi:uncharacterized protein